MVRLIWFSCRRFTVGVVVDEDWVIRESPPIVRAFVGQPLASLRRWAESRRWGPIEVLTMGVGLPARPGGGGSRGR